MELDKVTSTTKSNGIVPLARESTADDNLPASDQYALLVDMDTDTSNNVGKDIPHKRRRTSSISEPLNISLTDDGSQSAMQPSGWQSTIEHAVKAIVSIRFSQVAAFDTESK
jgi:hypothetical protein